MTPPTCTSIVEEYLTSLRNGFSVSEWSDGCNITTPYLLPDNSRISLSVIFTGPDKVSVSDFGETFDRLYLTGVNLSPSDWRVVSSAKRFGVGIENGEISVTAQPDELDTAIHNVCHAILDLSYLTYGRTPRVAPDFERAVEDSILEHNWRFEKKHRVVGFASTHEFDFLIMDRSPVLVEALTAREPSRANIAAKLSAFKVADSRRLDANAPYHYLCLLDDRDQERIRAITDVALGPLEGYFDRVMPLGDFQRIPSLDFA
jgi:hypothetical protein